MPTSFLVRSAVGEGLPSASWPCGVLVLGVVLLLSFTAKADQAREYEFDIPKQGIETALSTLATQAGTLLLFPYDLVQPVDSKPVSGRYTVEDALAILLEGTGLTGGLTEGGVITISRAGAIDSQGETIMAQNHNKLSGSKASTKRRGLLGMLAAVFSAGVGAQDAADVDEEEVGIEEIVVTGTNIRGVENPTVPVLQFDREDIDLSGAATVDDFLRTIPQNFASETQLTANSANPNDSGRNLTQGSSVDLRGLGAGSTLTLLNGRRMTYSGDTNTVDINVLPLGVIERVDIVTDGATAIYGSDAVGGVINFVTRKDYVGFDVNANYGAVTEGSRESFGAGAAGGTSWDSGGAFVGVDYQKAKPLLFEERDFIDLTHNEQFGIEGATFGSDSERLSVAGGLGQALGSKTRIGVDVLFTDISNEATSVLSSNPQISLSEQNALFVNSRLEFDVTEKLLAELFFDYGSNRVDTTNSFPITNTAGKVNRDNDLVVLEGRLSGVLFDLTAGPTSFSIGGLYRGESYKNNNDNGLIDIAADRYISALYTELLVPIFGDEFTLPFVRSLEASIAGRYEDYSDFGDTFDPKIGLHWEVNDVLSFRGSYSESFRAPDLNSLNQQRVFGTALIPSFLFTSVTPPEPFTTVPFPQVMAIFPSGGNPNLTPETADTISTGFTFEPRFLEGLRVEGNYFDIEYTDRIEAVSVLEPVQDPNFADLAIINPSIAEVESIFALEGTDNVQFFNFFGASPEDVSVIFSPFFRNLSRREVRGVDLNIDYSADTAAGLFSAGLNGSHLIDYKASPSENAPSSEQADILYRPVGFRLRGNFSWSKNGLTAFTAINYVDDYRDNPDRSVANDIGSWTTIDLSIAYDTGSGRTNSILNDVRLGFSVINLLDEEPPFARTPFGLNFDSANANPYMRQVNFTISKQL